MPLVPMPPSLAVGETRVHRFQVLREHRDGGGHEDWVVVGFGPEAVEVASLDFVWTRKVPTSAVGAGGVPVWGY